MITEIITTGTELLLGEITNENSQWLAQFLNEHGFTVAYMTTVGDNRERMKEALEVALGRAQLVITSGGLGSTQGDITKEVGAKVMGLPFVCVEEEVKRLRAYYEGKGRTYLPSLERQAWFAKGSHILPNDAGSAAGAVVEGAGKILVHLPGPPFEMKTMAETYMMPYLEKHWGLQGVIRSMVLPIEGLSEAEIEEKIMDLIQNQGNPTLALLARPGYIALRLTAKAETGELALSLLHPLAEEIKKRLPVSTYHIEQKVRGDVTKLLLQKHITVSAAESCTGGLIGKLLTDLPGSSSYFKGSAVTYWNEAKEKVLGVDGKTLLRYTAVSQEVAFQMAEGSRKLYDADIAVSTTGYAGPGLGERGEEPGLVYIGISGPCGTEVHKENFMGSRKSVRYGAAEKALYYIMQYVMDHKEYFEI